MKSLERQRCKQTFVKTTWCRREDIQHRLGKLTRLDSNLWASVGQDLRGELTIPSTGILIANRVCIEENFASSLPPVILLQSVYSRTANKFWKLGSKYVANIHDVHSRTHTHGSVQRTAARSSLLSDSRSWINTKRKPWKRVHCS